MTSIDFTTVCRLAAALAGVEEGTSYGTPAFRVRGKLMARMLDDDSIVVKIDPAERKTWTARAPETFLVTDHYRNYPMMVVRLDRVSEGDLRTLFEGAWRLCAPRPRKR